MPRKQTAKFGKADGFSWAVNVDGIDNEFFRQPFGRRLDDQRKASEFAQSAKTAYVNAKGRATLTEVRRWVRENQPSQFFARWRSDSANWKDDVVMIAYVD